jgi:two-component system KDP operon response regulator KdpE
LTDGVFEYGDLRVDFGETKVTLGDRVVNLTPKEYKILWHLIKWAGKIVPTRTLLGQVWGREYLEDTHFLKVHIKHLRDKLGDQAAAPKYIFSERHVGYRFAKVTPLRWYPKTRQLAKRESSS